MKTPDLSKSIEMRPQFEDIRHVILDRDGVLNQEDPGGNYIADPDGFHWLPRSLSALATLRTLGLHISVATNQAGIGRGVLSETDLKAVHLKMMSEAAAAHGSIDSIHYCPHLPTDNCHCRKPAAGLIIAAIDAAAIPAANTLVIGDDIKDLQAAISSGSHAALVRTGKGTQHEALAATLGLPIFDDLDTLADALRNSLKAAEPAAQLLESIFEEHSSVIQLAVEELIPTLAKCIALALERLHRGCKIMACGNGGSSADAQHFIAELVGRYRASRRALPGVVLATDSATFTAISNDFGFEQVFSRQVEALARQGDILIALSTSGNSSNVINAADSARAHGCTVIAFTGRSGGELARHADLVLAVPSNTVARIQEVHGLCLHALAEGIDEGYQEVHAT